MSYGRRGEERPSGLDGAIVCTHTSAAPSSKMRYYVTRAGDSRRRIPQQGQLRRPGRNQSRSWRGRRGRPADEARLRQDGGRGAQ